MGELGFLGAPIPEALRRRRDGLHQLRDPVRGAGARRHRVPRRPERPRRAQLADAAAVGDRGAAAALARPAGARREARDVRADRAGRRDRRRQPRRRPPAATATRTASTARRSGSRLADIADHFLVFASVDRSKKHKGVTAFMLERGMAGLTTGTLHGKLGIRAGQHRADQPRRRAGAGREPDRRGGRGLPDRDERHRPGPLHRRGRRRRARPGLPRRIASGTPTSGRRSARRSASTSSSSR